MFLFIKYKACIRNATLFPAIKPQTEFRLLRLIGPRKRKFNFSLITELWKATPTCHNCFFVFVVMMSVKIPKPWVDPCSWWDFTLYVKRKACFQWVKKQSTTVLRPLKTCTMPFSATLYSMYIALKNVNLHHRPFCLANHEVVHSLKQYTLAFCRNRNLKQFSLSQEMCGVLVFRSKLHHPGIIFF